MPKFQIYKGRDPGEQCWRWRLLCDDNTNIGRSEEPFLKDSIIPSIKKIKENVKSAPIAEDESVEDKEKDYRFEYFQSKKNDKWYWRFKAGNHEKMAISGEGFSSKDDICNQIDIFKKSAIDASILDKLTIIINGREKSPSKESLSFEEIVTLAFNNISFNLGTIHTVTWANPQTGQNGNLVRGNTVTVECGMVFNVTQTDKS